MTNILICGCGALGSNIAMNILAPEHNYTLIDDERVEQENLQTTVYNSSELRVLKVDALASQMIFKMGAHLFTTSFPVIPLRKTLQDHKRIQRKLSTLRWSDNLIIDTFDNIEARSYTTKFPDIPTVHVSIGEHGIGAIEWNNVFNLPTEGYPRGENPICTNELGRNLILFTSTVASVIINKFLATGVKESAYVNVNNLEVYR